MSLHQKREWQENCVSSVVNQVMEGTVQLRFDSLKVDSTALVVVDMVNGFVKQGALSSPNHRSVLKNVERCMRTAVACRMPVVCFADSHRPDSPEFCTYPIHCLEGSEESMLCDELRKIGGYTLVAKNSTNGALEPEFARWLERNPDIHTFLVAGCCTDICVLQFALSLQAEFHRQNRPVRIIVPAFLTSTYHAPEHDEVFSDLAAYQILSTNGIEVVSSIQY